MNIFEQHKNLVEAFKLGKDFSVSNYPVEVKFYDFKSNIEHLSNKDDVFFNIYPLWDDNIKENCRFLYPIFKLKSQKKYDNAILLLHGLNERSWEKYITWGEYLCMHTRRPVIMFPIAFHINRSASSWLDPRSIFAKLTNLLKTTPNRELLSIANLTLSERLIENPIRFYLSGKQSLNDIKILIRDIKSGSHKLFSENCHIDIFAYSIGAFLAQIALMINPYNLFDKTKVLLFCGGSIFNKMNGISKNIMDKKCFETLNDFYSNSEWFKNAIASKDDIVLKSFATMVSQEIHEKERYHFFESLGNNLKIITLAKDKVITSQGVMAAVGNVCFNNTVIQKDFDYVYSHEYPFPMNHLDDKDIINSSFNDVFSQIVNFYK